MAQYTERKRLDQFMNQDDQAYQTGINKAIDEIRASKKAFGSDRRTVSKDF
jgi:hypothetical protein